VRGREREIEEEEERLKMKWMAVKDARRDGTCMLVVQALKVPRLLIGL